MGVGWGGEGGGRGGVGGGGGGGCFFFQAEDGIRDLVRSRGLGDVYKRQPSAPDVPLPLVALQPSRVDTPAAIRRR